LKKEGTFIDYHNIDYLYELINSDLQLKKATIKDAENMFKLQKEIFMPLYTKYQDHETSPVMQSFDRFARRFEAGDYYKIMHHNQLIGSVYVFEKEPGVMRFHIINIKTDYQNKGFAQKAMNRLEKIYPQAKAWELDTIASEKRNCYLYEKMGYHQSGDYEIINEHIKLVTYVKKMS